MIKGKANIVMDGQFGSTGKGKLVGYLALKHEITVAVCDFMSNAGHTFMYDNGKKVVVCQIPMSVVNKDAILCINPGAAITVEKLLQEVEEQDCAERLLIHPHAAIILEDDKRVEAVILKKFSSTMKGCGGSLSRKVMRIAKLAKDEPRLKHFIHDTTTVVHSALQTGGTVLIEGAQGFDLSLNHGHSYPYVTSRDVTPMSILNHAGVPPILLGDVYGSLRTFPIRVGHVMDENGGKLGDSGPCYEDQHEITWEELRKESGAEHDLTERTTVTNRVRRVFTFSCMQLHKFIQVCAPTKLFINFINHVNAEDEGIRDHRQLSEDSLAFLTYVCDFMANAFPKENYIKEPGITHLGTGPRNSDIIDFTRGG